ncbi:MAG: hypothetical protein ACR2J8_10490 [Thermomicrobiales bacterium]
MASESERNGGAAESLNDIGLRYGTDKADRKHDYLRHYETELGGLRDEPFDLLEIGVRFGDSIRMWHDYFPKATIVGVDIKTVALGSGLDRFIFHRGDQADAAFLDSLIDTYRFQVMVDDGSHFWDHQIFSFQHLFPALLPGGVYICEDLLTSYPKRAEKFRNGAEQSGMQYFLKLAEYVTGGGSGGLDGPAGPEWDRILAKVDSIRFIRHAAIIRARVD